MSVEKVDLQALDEKNGVPSHLDRSGGNEKNAAELMAEYGIDEKALIRKVSYTPPP